MRTRCAKTFLAALLALAATAAAQTVTISVTKIWDDADDQDGIRPEGLRLTLYADGVYKDVASLSAASGWAAAWENLPALDGGKAIEYDVREDTVPTGYSISSLMRTGAPGEDSDITITDTHTPETVTVSVSKVWDDANDQDGKRPDTLVLSLYADGTKQADASLSTANGWAASWHDLPAFDSGKTIEYEVREDAVPVGYSLTSVMNDDNVWTFTDTHTPETVTISVSKVWDDANDQDGKRPGTLVLSLYADGTKQADASLSAANGWASSWHDLPAFDSGKAIEYEVREDAVPDGYSLTSVMNDDNAWTFTDTHTPETVTVSVSKVWDDADDQDGKRPGTLVFSLYADGTKQADASLSAANGWAASWHDLPAFDSGKAIEYEVREDAVPVGYSLTSVMNDDNVWTFTDTHTPETVTVSVSKVWDDADDQDGIRPAELRLTLYANDVSKDATTLSAASGWTASWHDLPAFAAGKAIKYDVREDTIPTGYSIASLVRSDEGGIISVTITDVHVPVDPPELKATATWTLDRSTGLIGGLFTLSNTGERAFDPDFDFWIATPGNRPEWHLWDTSGQMPDAADWFDLTSAVQSALAQTGNHDTLFDPGESVTIPAPRVYHIRRVSPNAYLEVQAAVHAGRLFHVSDTNHDFILSDAELSDAQAAWTASLLSDADLLDATRLHTGAAYLWDDTLQNWDPLATDLR